MVTHPPVNKCEQSNTPVEPEYFFRPVESLDNERLNAVEQLRDSRLQQSSRPFLARGHRIVRCRRCMLSHCCCAFKQPQVCSIDFALLFHRNEVLKPTNSGRLIADCFPTNTWASIWHRTTPPQSLLALLSNPNYQPILLFPGELNPIFTHESNYEPNFSIHNKKLILIILDATWKQARKIYLQSPWLHQIPRLLLTDLSDSHYQLRQAPDKQQLSTAEAVACALQQLKMAEAAHVLTQYFNVFNRHYLAMRSNTEPQLKD